MMLCIMPANHVEEMITDLTLAAVPASWLWSFLSHVGYLLANKTLSVETYCRFLDGLVVARIGLLCWRAVYAKLDAVQAAQ